MSKILDLKQISNKNTFDIKLFDDSVLKIKKPTQQMFVELVQLQELDDDDYMTLLEALYNVMFMILNNNTENRAFDKSYVSDNFDIELLKVVIESYFSFAKNLLSEKN
ncbi:MAG: hypothetical protein PHE63_00245 [Eubacteriales bacterium]|nr:hypothetical protein [Eubacteriales bacterium]